MAAAGYRGQCGVDKRWDEFDHLTLLRRYVEPPRIEPAPRDTRAFQALLDEALAAWSADDGDGGWAAFAADAVAALRELARHRLHREELREDLELAAAREEAGVAAAARAAATQLGLR
jgi:hypothetical protein